MSGLPEELRSMVKTHNLETLSKVFELARLQENAFEAYHKKYKSHQKTNSMASVTQTPAHYHLPHAKPVIANVVKKPTPQN